MNSAEFGSWLQTLANEGRLTDSQVGDLFTQRRLFDARRQMIEAEFRGRVVGYCAGELHVDETIDGLLSKIVATFAGAYQVYFEPVGRTVFGAETV